MRSRRSNGAYFAGKSRVGRGLYPPRLTHEHEQRASVSAAERTRKAAGVDVDLLENIATFANADAALVRHIAVPRRLRRSEGLRAVGIPCDDFTRAPVGDPQATVVPSWRFTKHERRSRRRTARDDCGGPRELGRHGSLSEAI
jgi:hypothetical protein